MQEAIAQVTAQAMQQVARSQQDAAAEAAAEVAEQVLALWTSKSIFWTALNLSDHLFLSEDRDRVFDISLPIHHALFSVGDSVMGQKLDPSSHMRLHFIIRLQPAWCHLHQLKPLHFHFAQDPERSSNSAGSAQLSRKVACSPDMHGQHA